MNWPMTSRTTTTSVGLEGLRFSSRLRALGLFSTFKSNRGDAAINIGKREEAARQLLAHAAEMERIYSQNAKVVTIIAGDFNTDPTDARLASEGTFGLLREKFIWAWENIPLSERVTNPANGRYPDACFDGFLVRGARILSCRPMPIQGVSDHYPAILTVSLD